MLAPWASLWDSLGVLWAPFDPHELHIDTIGLPFGPFGLPLGTILAPFLLPWGAKGHQNFPKDLYFGKCSKNTSFYHEEPLNGEFPVKALTGNSLLSLNGEFPVKLLTRKFPVKLVTGN